MANFYGCLMCLSRNGGWSEILKEDFFFLVVKLYKISSFVSKAMWLILDL